MYNGINEVKKGMPNSTPFFNNILINLLILSRLFSKTIADKSQVATIRRP